MSSRGSRFPHRHVQTRFGVPDEPPQAPGPPPGRDCPVSRGGANPAPRREHGARRHRRAARARPVQPREAVSRFRPRPRGRFRLDAQRQRPAEPLRVRSVQQLILRVRFRHALEPRPPCRRPPASIKRSRSSKRDARALERLALGNAMLEVEKTYADALEAKTREETWDKAEHLTKQWISTVQDQDRPRHVGRAGPPRAAAVVRERARPASLFTHGLQRGAERPRPGQRLGLRGTVGPIGAGRRCPPLASRDYQGHVARASWAKRRALTTLNSASAKFSSAWRCASDAVTSSRLVPWPVAYASWVI